MSFVDHHARPAPGWVRHPGVRVGPQLGPGERFTDLVWRAAGSWVWLVVVVATAAAALVADRRWGTGQLVAAVPGVLALVQVSVLASAARRAERIAVELTLYRLDQARRDAAVAEDLRADLARLQAEVARLAAHGAVTGRPGPR